MGMEEEEHLERENAQIFLNSLKDELKYLTSARGTIDIDQRLQEFASKYCHGKFVNLKNLIFLLRLLRYQLIRYFLVCLRYDTWSFNYLLTNNIL